MSRIDTAPEAAGTKLVTAIRAEALRLGFDAVGIVAVRASDHAAFYRAWLAAGREFFADEFPGRRCIADRSHGDDVRGL